MKTTKFLFAAFTLAITISLTNSCGTQQEPSLFTSVMKTTQGDIRGITLNSDIETVKKAEESEPDSIAEDYLLYNYKIPTKNALIKIEYSFDEKGLYSADVVVKINNADTTKAVSAIDTLETKIVKLLSKKYGSPFKLSGEVSMWNYTSQGGSAASVQLINNTAVEDVPTLEILVQTEVE
jgi:hypothetical protein